MECLEIVNPKANIFRCKISGTTNPICAQCIVNSMIEDMGKQIIDKDRHLKEELLKAEEYKVKADKYDEICRFYADEITRIATKALLKFGG